MVGERRICRYKGGARGSDGVEEHISRQLQMVEYSTRVGSGEWYQCAVRDFNLVKKGMRRKRLDIYHSSGHNI